MNRLRNWLLLPITPVPPGMTPSGPSDFSLQSLTQNINKYAEAAVKINTLGTSVNLTTAQILAKNLVLEPGASGPFTITLPPTSVILDALGPTMPLDGTFFFELSMWNNGTNFVGTLTPGDSSTTIDSVSLPTDTVCKWMVRVDPVHSSALGRPTTLSIIRTSTAVSVGAIGSGTVTSVGLTTPPEFTVTGSPVTTTGTLGIVKATETANTVWAGPTSGGAAQPTFRALVPADIAGADQNAFGAIAVSGQSTVPATAPSTTLNLVAGTNVTITTNPGAESVTINSSGGGGGSLAIQNNAVTLPTEPRLNFIGHSLSKAIDNPGNTSSDVELYQTSIYNIKFYGAVGNGVTDDTAAIQAAIDDATAATGGIVLLPAGNYKCTGVLNLKDNVSLVGSATGPTGQWHAPSSVPRGTTISITNTSTTFINSTGSNTSVRNIIFYYPSQALPTATSFTVYPYTITSTRGDMVIDGCSFVNCYNGIDCESGRIYISNIAMCALNIGINIDKSADVLEINNVLIASYLYDGFLGPGTYPFPQNMDNYCLNNTIGVNITRSDGFSINGLVVLAAQIGINIVDSVAISPSNSYGQINNVQLDTVKYGIICKSTRDGVQTGGIKVMNFIILDTSGLIDGTGASVTAIWLQSGGSQPPLLMLVNGSIRTVAGWSGGRWKVDAGTMNADQVYGIDLPPWFVMTDGATITPNLVNGPKQTVTLGGNRTIAAPTNIPCDGYELWLLIKQDGTGSRTATWNAVYLFFSSGAKTLSTGANAVDLVACVYQQAVGKWFCQLSPNAQ